MELEIKLSWKLCIGISQWRLDKQRLPIIALLDLTLTVSFDIFCFYMYAKEIMVMFYLLYNFVLPLF